MLSAVFLLEVNLCHAILYLGPLKITPTSIINILPQSYCLMSIAILSIGLPTKYCCNGALDFFSGGFRAAHWSHFLHQSFTIFSKPVQKKAKRIFLEVFSTPIWPPVLWSWRCSNTSRCFVCGTNSCSLHFPVRSEKDLLKSKPLRNSSRSHWAHKDLKSSDRWEISCQDGRLWPSSIQAKKGPIIGLASWLNRIASTSHPCSQAWFGWSSSMGRFCLLVVTQMTGPRS